MENKNNIKTNDEYKIIPTFSNDGKKIEDVIEGAFLKYLNFNDYK